MYCELALMKKNEPKIIVILGQTSSGKSDFAVEVARAVGGEIISADSRQVYRGLDLGTGKITKKEMRGVPHHLLDVASARTIFDVSKFKKLADKKIEEITKKGKVPILCGGTGFYIDAVVNGVILPEVQPNKKLRMQLEKKSKEFLFKQLKKLDSERAKTIDKNNPVRLIRAIEIATALGSVPSLRTGRTCAEYDVIKIGLTLPDKILKERIRIRLFARIREGMIKEVKDLHISGLSWKRLEMLGLEYRHCALYLQGKLSKPEMLSKLETEIWHYAKRQKTWFKRDPNTLWISPLKISEKAKALKKVKEFLK